MAVSEITYKDVIPAQAGEVPFKVNPVPNKILDAGSSPA
jgi:hypothetical protein